VQESILEHSEGPGAGYSSGLVAPGGDEQCGGALQLGWQ
jgi:hypothetical protein